MRERSVLITTPAPAGALSQGIANRLRGAGVTVELRREAPSARAHEPAGATAEASPVEPPVTTIAVVGPSSASDGYRAALAATDDTLYVAAVDGAILVGPRVRGASGPCHACLLYRMLACRTTGHTGDPDALLRFGDPDAEDAPLQARAIEAVVRILDEEPAVGPGPSQVIACTAASMQAHWLVRRDDCPACGERHVAAEGGRARTAPASRPGPRVLLDPLCGVIAAIEDVPTLASCTDAAVDAPWLARATLGNHRLLDPRRSTLVTHGTGWRPDQARLRALQAALASYAAWCWRPDRLVRATRAALGRLALDPLQLAGYRPEVHAVAPYRPYREDVPIAWMLGRSLLDGSARMVPARAAHPRLPHGWEEPVLWEPVANGTGSGRDADTAELAALLELVERDAFFMAWYCRVPVVAIDLRTHPRMAVRTLVRRCTAEGIEVRAIELPTALPAKVVAVMGLVREYDEDRPAVSLGLGTAATRVEAAAQAALEMLASHTELSRRLADPEVRRLRQALVSGREPVRNAMRHRLWFSHPVGLVAIGRLLEAESSEPAPWEPDEPPPARAALRALVEHLRAERLEAVALEIAPPSLAELGWSVVRVVAPELQPPWFDQRHPRLSPLTERRAAALGGRPVLDVAELVRDVHPLG